MDNSPIHRKGVIRELVEATGHQVLFLPTYSPNLNDIEQRELDGNGMAEFKS